jgi:diamine N-acetyltransferase
LTLQTEYLALGRITRIRRFTRDDVDRWVNWPKHTDPLFEAYDSPSMSPGMRDGWYDDLVRRQGQAPYAVDNVQGDLIGRIFLRHQHRPEGSATLGIDLASAYLNRGMGTDALRTFLSYFFDELAFDRMYLSVAAFNGRARRVYVKLGFRDVNEYWDVIRTSAPVLRSPKYAPIAHLFKRGDQGLEALHSVMVLNAAGYKTVLEREAEESAESTAEAS